MFETWYKMASLIQSGLDLSPMLTHEFAADDYLDGFKLMESGKSGKVILNWCWAMVYAPLQEKIEQILFWASQPQVVHLASLLTLL